MQRESDPSTVLLHDARRVTLEEQLIEFGETLQDHVVKGQRGMASK